MTDGIHVPRDVADQAGLPADLDSSVAGTYRFPDPRRRRVPAYIYATAVPLAALGRLWFLAFVCAVLAVWHWLAAHQLVLNQEQALAKAAGTVPFAVGHASAALAFVGVRSRPRWQVVLYSAEDPPRQRALVEVDGVNGEALGDPYVEELADPGITDEKGAGPTAGSSLVD